MTTIASLAPLVVKGVQVQSVRPRPVGHANSAWVTSEITQMLNSCPSHLPSSHCMITQCFLCSLCIWNRKRLLRNHCCNISLSISLLEFLAQHLLPVQPTDRWRRMARYLNRTWSGNESTVHLLCIFSVENSTCFHTMTLFGYPCLSHEDFSMQELHRSSYRFF